MPAPFATRLRRLFRSPWTITVELAGIAIAGAAATLIEQHPSDAERAAFGAARPAAASLVSALRLDRIFTAEWFLGVVVLAGVSLGFVVWEQWGRLAREWGAPSEASFRAAPLRRELRRPARGGGRRITIRTRGRIGVLGSPLFHSGLFLVTLAALARLLLGADASREAMEGDFLPRGPRAFERQDTGLLAAPVTLPHPIRFDQLTPTYYPTGELLGLTGRVAELGGGEVERRIAVNAPLQLGATRLYLTQKFGPYALLEIQHASTSTRRAALLRFTELGDFEYRETLPGPLDLLLRAPPETGEARPRQELEIRALSGTAVLAVGRLRPGAVLPLPGGGFVALHRVGWWAQLLGSRDPTASPIFAGFAVAIVGVVLMFGFVRTDTLVLVEPAGEEEVVTVALRPRRLPALYAEDFERLVERESRGG